MEVFFVVFHTSPLVWVGDFMLRKEPRNTEAPHINIQSPKKTSQHIKFSHKKKYCGIKDIRVLFYSSIFQMIIVFPFIVLKYFSFCCHSSHSVLCCNRLVYSCFILIVKSDSKLILNSSCQFFIPFHFCLLSVSVYILFFYLYNLTFLISDCILFFSLCILSFLILFSCYFVSFIILSFLLFCLYVILSLFFLSFLLFCLYVILSFLCYSVSFHVFVALPLPLFPPSFWLHFYSFTCLFFDIFA